ncbi:MAG: lipopolysaccharide heptosyltransferase II [Candidatus Omnitrophica bacterium]|nr:lipopolysaccharide heptosyltransferase II [Candidatus Omnitrophota bacterium]
MKNDRGNFVILRTDRIGEVLLASILADNLKAAFPLSKIDFVTSKYSADVLKGNAAISDILEFDTIIGKNVFFGGLKLARRLKSGKYDAAFVLNPHKTLHLGCFLAGIPLRVGYNRKWGFLLTKTTEDPREKGLKHETEYALDILKLAGIEGKIKYPKLYPGLEQIETVALDLKNNDIDTSKPVIVIHASASNPAKMWPKRNYAELITKIKNTIDCGVVLTGDMESHSLAEEIVKVSGKKCFNASGKFNLGETGALLKEADVFIGNDSGPMHMAAAAGACVIAIFGRNIPGVGPKRWGPCGEGHVVFHKADCEVCRDTNCPHGYRCLMAITPEEVFAAVKKKLG